MSNLISYGCSCTYGVGLPDIKSSLELGPSKYAWPILLAKKLNLNCINNGHAGAGNLEILKKILNSNFADDDLVIVLWSFFERDYVFQNDGTGKQFGSWTLPITDRVYWTKIHNDYDFRMRSWIHIYTAWLHLTKLKKKFYFGLLPDVKTCKEEFFLEIQPEWSKDIKFAVTDFRQISLEFDLGEDKLHPGPASHAHLAEKFFEYIKNDNRI